MSSKLQGGEKPADLSRKPSSSPVFLIGNRYGHHARHSGYEGFRRYVGVGLKAPVDFRFLKIDGFPMLGWKIDTAVGRILGRECYSLALLLTEASAALHTTTHAGAIYHFLYGDTDACWLGKIRKLSDVSVIATFHEAAEGLEYLRIDRRVTDHLDAVILVSSSQREYFEKFFPAERIFVVPHGIDTEFFHPAAERATAPICITVGGHLRDFDTLAKAIDIIHATIPAMRFIAVGVDHGHNGPKFTHSKVEFLSGISDEDLRRLYQEAAVAVFSLKQASANNSLLEAMACGVPVVATDVGGVREYLGGGGLLVPEYDPESMAANVRRVLTDEALASRLGESGREAASRHDYSIVAEIQRAAYDQISDFRKTRN